MSTAPAPLPPAAQRLADRSPRPWCALTVLLVVLLAGLATWHENQHRRSRTQSTAQNLARQLEAPLADALVQADVLLRTAAMLWRETAGSNSGSSSNAMSTPTASALRALAAAAPESSALRIADAEGRWQLASGKAPGAAVSSAQAAAKAAAALTQREEFQRARAEADAGLIITGPVQRNADDPAALVLSRALHGADGRFAGLVSVDLPIQRLATLLGATDVGDRSIASLRTASLARVAQSPAPDDTTPALDSAIASAALHEAVAINPLAGLVEVGEVSGTAGGALRLQAYRQVQGYPLYVLLDLPGDGPAQGWNLADTVIAMLALAALGAAARAGQLQQRRGQRQRDAALQPWGGFVAASHDAVISETLGGLLTAWNPAARKLFGYSDQQMLGGSLQRLVPATRREQTAEWMAQGQGGRALTGLNTEWVHRDGQAIPILLMVLPTRDAIGQVSGLSYIVRDLSAGLALQEALRQQAFHDPLTGLPNRRLLHDRLGRAQQNSRRLGSLAAVLALGLDPSEPLQLRRGPAADEQWLLTVARRLVGAVRETDTVARLDGAEFMVICENLGADPALASLRAAALEAKINSALTQPLLAGGAVVCGQVSIGHRLFSGSDDDIDQLIADAGRAMLGHRAQQAPRPAAAVDDGADHDDDFDAE